MKEKKKDKHKEFKGQQLMQMLWKKMIDREESPADVADKIGISYGYLMHLNKGERPVNGMSIDSLRLIADYLSITTAHAALVGGFFEPKDFYLDASIEDRVEIAFKGLKEDPVIGGFAVANDVWESLNPEVKFLISVLFENKSRTNILDATGAIE